MARKAPGTTPGRVEWYTPKADGNRLAPEDDRVRVRLRMPTAADQRRAFARAVEVRDVATGEVSVGSYAIAGQELCRLCVLEVKNYDTPAGEPMADGEDFATHAEDAFLSEVGDVLMGATALTTDWCKACGTALTDLSKACSNKKCKSKEVVEGEEAPSAASSGSSGSESLSEPQSVTEGRSDALDGADSRGSGTSSGAASSSFESARAAG